jgi:predicted AAA+ superfamily ATPase
LLNIPDTNQLLGHPVIGGSWEGFVIENILSVAPSGVQPFYYGTQGGAEIDLILEFSGATKWAIEIKRSSSPTVNKGFHIACEDINPARRYLVYAGTDRFSLGNGVTAISLSDLMREVMMHS